jgi:hypothetical protein
MSIWAWWINLLGLILTLIGSGYMFLGSAKERPEEYSSFHTGSLESLEKERKKRITEAESRKKSAVWGFGLLSLGIVFQVVSFLMQYPSV